jgi:hypothetical protein
MASFAEELNRLALTISVVTEESWRDIVKDLDIYFSEKVGALYWEIALSGANVGNMPGLETIAPESGKGTYYTLKRNNNKTYEDYRALAFSKDKPLWIIEKEGKELCHLKAILVDNWSNLHEDSEFPKKFPKSYCSSAKTALYYPLKFQKTIFGVFVLENKDLKTLTPEMKNDINLAIDALSRIVRIWQMTKEQIDALRDGEARFRRFVVGAPSITERQKIFLASPKNRDEEIWKAVDAVTQKYNSRFEIIKWDEKTTPGNIMEQIYEDAVHTALAICLVSEKISPKRKKPSASDNVNVIFEAGVFQALVESLGSVCKACLVIREDEKIASQPFFDIAQQRICIIDRDDKNKFISNSFCKKLEDMMEESIAINKPN